MRAAASRSLVLKGWPRNLTGSASSLVRGRSSCRACGPLGVRTADHSARCRYTARRHSPREAVRAWEARDESSSDRPPGSSRTVPASSRSSLSLDAAFAEDTTVSFELSEAKRRRAPPAVTGSPVRRLSPEETARLLSRLPAASARSPAPPAAEPEGGGPPAGARSAAAALQGGDDLVPPTPAQPLRIVRHAPDGAVSLAADLSVTFSEAMVPLASDEDLAQGAVPVRLTPEPPGRWRWLDTHTLLFTPDGRFPMATSYIVEVPAGHPIARGQRTRGRCAVDVHDDPAQGDRLAPEEWTDLRRRRWSSSGSISGSIPSVFSRICA